TESARQVGQSGGVMAFIAASKAEHTKRTNEAREHADRLAASEHTSRQLLGQIYAESGRQLLLESRAQEAIAYLVAARQCGLDDPPLRTLFDAAKRQLPI